MMSWIFPSGVVLVAVVALLGIAFRQRRVVHRLSEARRLAEERANRLSQAAHDVRSPLQALYSLLENFEPMPEPEKRVVEKVAAQIQGVADRLLVLDRSTASGAPVTCQNLARLSRETLIQKRFEYQSLPHIELDLDHGGLPSEVSANVNPTEFKSMLSNLVNNAVEALPTLQGGFVLVTVRPFGEFVHLSVTDNGAGVAQEVLPRLFNRGVTFGKRAGNGLGLFDAKEKIEGWGGQIALDSSEGQGTTVNILIPRAEPMSLRERSSFA